MKSDSTIDGTSFLKNTIQKELKVAINIIMCQLKSLTHTTMLTISVIVILTNLA